jgi:hypothetical protein
MLTVTALLLLAAFVTTIAAAMNPPRVPLWVAVLLLGLVFLLKEFPR